MELSELEQLFMPPERLKPLQKLLKSRGAAYQKIGFYGLAGSSAAMTLAGLARGQASPMVIVGDSRDDAGYLYHDLSRLLGEESVLVLPSAYRRDIKYGQIDPASDVARTEALSSWHTTPTLKAVVTYPEALAEVVATNEDIKEHSRQLGVGETVDLIELEKWLRENDFKQVDYVYEPGQFAVRGSILDIFSYSHELPFRVDFFGDEIESIRTFNVDTQLSAEKRDQVNVIANMSGKSDTKGISLLEFINPDTVIAMRDAAYTVERIRAIEK